MAPKPDLKTRFSQRLRAILSSYEIKLVAQCDWVIPEKIHTPTTEGMLENLTGGGVNGSGNPDGRGALNLKIHLSA